MAILDKHFKAAPKSKGGTDLALDDMTIYLAVAGGLLVLLVIGAVWYLRQLREDDAPHNPGGADPG